MAIIAALMWLGHRWLGNDVAGGWLFFLGLAFCVAGVGVAVTGFRTMMVARTSSNPIQIDLATHLVSSGIFSRTRNPMYLGMVMVLIGVECVFANTWLLLGPIAFVIFIRWFQIAPEERMMQKKFGAEYDAYRQRVRRWI